MFLRYNLYFCAVLHSDASIERGRSGSVERILTLRCGRVLRGSRAPRIACSVDRVLRGLRAPWIAWSEDSVVRGSCAPRVKSDYARPKAFFTSSTASSFSHVKSSTSFTMGWPEL